MKLSEILRAGKARIETLGWCQGDDDAFTGPACCAATAVCHSGMNVDEMIAAIEFLKASIGIPPGVGLSIWNDEPTRTETEVLAAYNTAILLAEAQEQSA